MSLDYYVVLDFEATCDNATRLQPQEVIEFPSVLLSGSTLEVVSEFESFVQPLHHPTLSDFCRELTTITQADVDAAPTFPEVLERHMAWLREQGLPTSASESGPSYSFVLCGDWDLRTMLPEQAQACVPPLDTLPWPYRRWINIKRPFMARAGRDGRAPGMAGMLKALDLELVGTHHRGIDDCRNIARIVRALSLSGQPLEVTSTLPPSRYPEIGIVLERDGDTHEVVLKKRSLGSLLGLASGAFRKQAKRVRTQEGVELVDDEALCDLRTGARLVVE